MKRSIYLFLALCTISNAKNSRYGKVEVESLSCAGSLKLDGTHVKNTVRSSGQLKANNARIGQLFVSGYAKLYDTIIESSAHVSGSLTAEKTTFNNLNIAGSADIKSSTITNLLDVAGSLEAKNLTTETAKISGSMNIKNSTVNGKVLVTGSLDAAKTIFKNEIDIYSQATVFDGCTIQSIGVRKNNNLGAICDPYGLCAHKFQTITLCGKSTVNGSITFESEGGIVYLEKGSSIIGKVIGGIIVAR